MAEKISVILGTYNQARFLPQVIKGWENQSFKDFKLYICDDGSTDGTKSFFKGLKTSLEIEYFRQDHQGMRLAKNINQGLKAAQGEYALFVMGDSIPKPDYLEKFIPHLDPQWVLCGIRENVTEEGEHFNWDWRYRGRQSQIGWGFVPIIQQQWTRITGNGLLIPMAAIKGIGGWPEQVEGYGCDDNWIAMKLFAKGMEFADIPSAILQHIDHPSQDDNLDNIEFANKTYQKVFRELKKAITPQNIFLNFDDFSPVNTQLVFLRDLKTHFPKLKVTLFTIPETIQTGKVESFIAHPDLCDELREMDWLEFCPHGWSHPDQKSGYLPEFQEMTYLETSNYIRRVEMFFDAIKLPYQKIFKAPQYRISEAAKNCFRDKGWTLCVDGTGNYWPKDLKTIAYNWNILDEIPLRKNVISYGHVQDNGNGLHECYGSLLFMPQDAEFKFLSEYV